MRREKRTILDPPSREISRTAMKRLFSLLRYENGVGGNSLMYKKRGGVLDPLAKMWAFVWEKGGGNHLSGDKVPTDT